MIMVMEIVTTVHMHNLYVISAGQSPRIFFDDMYLEVKRKGGQEVSRIMRRSISSFRHIMRSQTATVQ